MYNLWGPLRGGGGGVGWCPWSEFQKLSFCISRRKPCHFRYFSIVFLLFPVAVAVSVHLCVVCRHFYCLVSLFQGHVACRYFTHTECVLLHFISYSAHWHVCFYFICRYAGYLIPQSLEEQAPLQSNTLNLSMDFPTSFGDGVEKMMTSTTGTYICATTVLLISMSPAYFSVTDLFCNMKMMWSSEIQIFRRR